MLKVFFIHPEFLDVSDTYAYVHCAFVLPYLQNQNTVKRLKPQLDKGQAIHKNRSLIQDLQLLTQEIN